MNRSRPPPVVVRIDGPISRMQIRSICERVGSVLGACEGDPLICDVGATRDPDAVLVEVLARLNLTAHRLGRRFLVRHAGRELLGLMAFMGLAGVIVAELPLEPEGQAEEREQPLGVEEERDP